MEDKGWSWLGDEGSAMENGFAGLLRMAGLWQTEVSHTLEALKAGNTKTLLPFGRKLHKALKANAKTDSMAVLSAMETFLCRYSRWMADMVRNLPVAFTEAYAGAESIAMAGENLRKLLDEAGQHGMLNQELQRSGLAEKQNVTRNPIKETEEDRLRQEIKSSQQRMQALEEKQRRLNERIGGAEALTLMERMLEGIEKALATEKQRMEELSATGRNPKENPKETEKRRETIHRLKTHGELLNHERQYLRDNMEACIKAGGQWAPPKADDTELDNPFLSVRFLQTLERYGLLETEDQREGESAKLQAECQISRDFRGLPSLEIWERLGRGVLSKEHPEADFLLRLMELTRKEGR